MGVLSQAVLKLTHSAQKRKPKKVKSHHGVLGTGTLGSWLAPVVVDCALYPRYTYLIHSTPMGPSGDAAVTVRTGGRGFRSRLVHAALAFVCHIYL